MRILVTGACGSVGSALVKRLILQGHTVCAYDQSEDGLFHLDQLYRTSAQGKLRTFLGNIRDLPRLKRAFESVDVVYHCAALKHVYLSEYNPFESVQTNIDGVNNVIAAAMDVDVEKVVFTSSDKAVNPSSTMGATKLLGERLITAANYYRGTHKTRFSCVRFGNVLNSNGSVLQVFRMQLQNNLPLTITSLEMTRFFLTLEDAVDLCITASEKMVGGEIFVRSMGCCNIMTIAKALAGDESFNYTVIGPKPGEKLYEELVTETEAFRTVYDDHLFIVKPDSLELLPQRIAEGYQQYNHLPLLTSSLRSDSIPMDTSIVRSVLAML
jgi:UDP-N-acetylglucosamine 4,6-dehydratase